MKVLLLTCSLKWLDELQYLALTAVRWRCITPTLGIILAKGTKKAESSQKEQSFCKSYSN